MYKKFIKPRRESSSTATNNKRSTTINQKEISIICDCLFKIRCVYDNNRENQRLLKIENMNLKMEAAKS